MKSLQEHIYEKLVVNNNFKTLNKYFVLRLYAHSYHTSMGLQEHIDNITFVDGGIYDDCKEKTNNRYVLYGQSTIKNAKCEYPNLRKLSDAVYVSDWTDKNNYTSSYNRDYIYFVVLYDETMPKNILKIINKTYKIGFRKLCNILNITPKDIVDNSHVERASFKLDRDFVDDYDEVENNINTLLNYYK